jgi:hypothetical protein
MRGGYLKPILIPVCKYEGKKYMGDMSGLEDNRSI